MKKKIKDLTLKEVEDICENKKKCKNCPIKFNNTCYRSWLEYLKDFREKEVEVDE